MPDFDSTREFHDELLSAYLDGELSPAERARVEERLAVDPVARQMLDELRSLSQAMQGLPRQRVGENLSEAILARAEQSMRSDSAAAAVGLAPIAAASKGDERAVAAPIPRSRSADSMPRFSIGRTRRGWVWAGLAVAAALLIMFVNRETERGKALPQVANRERLVRESDRGGRAAAPELRALDDEASKIAGRERTNAPRDAVDRLLSESEGVSAIPATAPPVAANAPTGLADDGRSSMGRDLSNAAAGKELATDVLETAADKPAAPAGGLAMKGSESSETMRGFGIAGNESLDDSARRRTETIAAGNAGGGREDQSGGEVATLGMPMARGAVSAAAPPVEEARRLVRSDLLIVRVNVKREALVRRAIDQKLATHQIVLEAPQPAAGEVASARPSSPQAAVGESKRAEVEADSAEYQNLSRLSASQQQGQQTDLLLVEAPPARIDQLLTDLDADADNVVSVSVEQAGDLGSLAGEAAPAGGAAQPFTLNWTKYKRLTVSQSLRQASGQQVPIANQPGLAAATPSASSLAMGGGGLGGGAGGGGFGAAAVGRGGRRGRGGGAGRGRAPNTERDGQPARQPEVATGQSTAELIDGKDRNRQASVPAATSPSVDVQTETRLGGRAVANGDIVALDTLGGTPTQADPTQMGRARRLSSLVAMSPAAQQHTFDLKQSSDELTASGGPLGARSGSQSESGQMEQQTRAAQGSDFFQFGGGAAAASAATAGEPAQQPLSRGMTGGGFEALNKQLSNSQAPSGGPTMRVLLVLSTEPEPSAASSDRAAPATTSPQPANPAK
jgi:hypothetical protein